MNSLIKSKNPVHPVYPVKTLRSAFRRRQVLDRLAEKAVILLSILPLLLALAILVGLALRASPILVGRNLFELLLGEKWLPSQGVFGFLPFLLGTIWVTTVAMFLAIPPSLFTAIYLAEYASGAVRSLVKPLLDLLAAIPSVVYGVWGLVAIVPWVQTLHTAAEQHLDFIPLLSSKNPTGFSILAGGIVLAVMVMPFIISVTYEVLHTVPSGAREASLALGATQWQTIRHAVIPQALPGILAGVVLGSSRALGETLAVLMVVGNVPQIPASIFDAAYPLPALIANNYGEMMSIPLYDSALLSAALILLVVVLFFNILSTLVLRLAITRRAAK